MALAYGVLSLRSKRFISAKSMLTEKKVKSPSIVLCANANPGMQQAGSFVLHISSHVLQAANL